MQLELRPGKTSARPDRERAISKTLAITASSDVNISAAMLLPRILAPVRASIQTPSTFILPASRVIDALRSANGASAHVPTLSFVRHSAHQAQGRANGAKDGPGKRLGAKKSGGTTYILDI